MYFFLYSFLIAIIINILVCPSLSLTPTAVSLFLKIIVVTQLYLSEIKHLGLLDKIAVAAADALAKYKAIKLTIYKS